MRPVKILIRLCEGAHISEGKFSDVTDHLFCRLCQPVIAVAVFLIIVIVVVDITSRNKHLTLVMLNKLR